MTKTQANTHYCTPTELREVMSHLQGEGTYFIAGSSSIFVPAGRRRYVDRSVCKPWADIDGYVVLHTPGEAARVELLREWPLLKKVGWQGDYIKLLKWRSPLLYTGPRVGEMIYVDLDGAYSQIYEKLWLDTPYPRGYYGQYPLMHVAYRLRDWKAARNSLIGIVRSTEMVAYRGTKRLTLRTKNKYLSPGLWATVQTTLHWIMSKAITLDAVYGNVDGYIFPLDSWEFVEEFLMWLSEQQIRWSIRSQGTGEIISWNNYQIGSVSTQAYRLGLTYKSRSFTNVRISDQKKLATYWGNLCRIARTK